MHDQLHEELDLIDPARGERGVDLFSDRAGTGHVASHGFAYDDHRDAHRDRLDADFAKEIAAQAVRVVREHGCRDLLVIASGRMLGALRGRLDSLQHDGVTIEELQRDYTQLPIAELRSHLTQLSLLPPRPEVATAGR